MRKLFIGLIITISYSLNAWAWDAEVTHRDLSQKAAENSVLGLAKGDYLKSLGFTSHLDEKFSLNGGTPQSVMKWISEVGAVDEDAGTPLNGRFYNHFHDPV